MWASADRLVLASSSPLRAALLRRAGLPVEAVDPQIDEERLRDEGLARGDQVCAVAVSLACAKAQAISCRAPDAFVLGFDQTLDFEGCCLSKPLSLSELRRRLSEMSGRRHALHSGFAVARAGHILDQGVRSAAMTMRMLSSAFIDAYLDMVGEDGLASVGGYRIEGPGVLLFDAIEGDLFTVMGTPVLDVLQVLRARDLVMS